MKFNCGLSPEAKRKLKDEAANELHRYLIEWHPFFALIPRRVGENDCRWLERIERKGTRVQRLCPTPVGMMYYWAYQWEYRAKQETK